jgi:hypothetical protein
MSSETSLAAHIDHPSAEPVSDLAFCFFGECRLRLWGLSPAERARKLLAKEGVLRELSISEAHARPIACAARGCGV